MSAFWAGFWTWAISWAVVFVGGLLRSWGRCPPDAEDRLEPDPNRLEDEVEQDEGEEPELESDRAGAIPPIPPLPPPLPPLQPLATQRPRDFLAERYRQPPRRPARQQPAAPAGPRRSMWDRILGDDSD